MVLAAILSLALIALSVYIGWFGRFEPPSSPHVVVYSAQQPLICAAFALDQPHVLVVRQDGTVDEIDVWTGQIVTTVNVPNANINGLAPFANGDKCLVAFATGGFGVMDRKTSTLERNELSGHFICFSGTGRGRAYGAKNSSPTAIWSVRGNSFDEVFVMNQSRLLSLADPAVQAGEVSKSGQYLAVSVYSGVLLLALDDVEERWASMACTSPLAFRSDSKLLATSRHDGRVSLIDPDAAAAERTIAVPAQGALTHLAFSPDGTVLVCATIRRLWHSATIVGISVTSGTQIWALEHKGRQIVAIGCVEKNVVVVEGDGRVLRYPIE
jgi:hypothetical protein